MKKGFTLGEVFTALVIVGILIAVLAPSVKNLVDKERKEALLFKKAYYALEKAVEASINDSRCYATITTGFSDTSSCTVDGNSYTGNAKFREFIKYHFNIVEEEGNSFTIKDNVKYIINDDDFSSGQTTVRIELEDNNFSVIVYSDGRMEPVGQSAIDYLEKQDILNKN